MPNNDEGTAPGRYRPGWRGLDPASAGCCVRFYGPARPDEGMPCPDQVAFVGTICTQHRGEQHARAVTAFACHEHAPVLTDPQRYGTHPEHAQEMIRRHRRDAWHR